MTRDSRIDTIKGVMLAIMLVDHLGGFFRKYTWQPLGYVSAAEGFVVVSGFLCAKVYGRYCDDYKELVARLLKRALVIYRYHVSAILALYLLTIIIPKYQDLFSKIFDTFHSNPVKATVLYLCLLYQPDFFCVLPMYIFLLLISPAFLLLMHRGLYSSALVISFATWILAQYYDPQKYLAGYFGYGKTDMFNVFAYQFIFVIGMYLGYSRDLLAKFCSNKRAFWSVLSLCLMLAFLRHSRISINYELLNERLSLPAPRMINFCLLLTPFWFFARKLPDTFHINYFQFLGRNSLQFFSLHVVTNYAFIPFSWWAEVYLGKLGPTVYCIFTFGAITCLLLAYKKTVAKFRSRFAADP